MAPGKRNDLLMQFYITENQPVNGECAQKVSASDPFMKGFKAAPLDSYSNFFEVTDFDLNVSLKETDESRKTPVHPSGSPPQPGQAKSERASAGPFASWRSASAKELRQIYYPLEFDTFTFKRPLDAATPVFFQRCCNLQAFEKAVLVKRRSRGSDPTGQGITVAAYLRIEFTKVLITGLKWDDGEMVEETVEFICQGMTVSYRRQRDDGFFDAPAADAVWSSDRMKRIFAGRKPG